MDRQTVLFIQSKSTSGTRRGQAGNYAGVRVYAYTEAGEGSQDRSAGQNRDPSRDLGPGALARSLAAKPTKTEGILRALGDAPPSVRLRSWAGAEHSRAQPSTERSKRSKPSAVRDPVNMAAVLHAVVLVSARTARLALVCSWLQTHTHTYRHTHTRTHECSPTPLHPDQLHQPASRYSPEVLASGASVTAEVHVHGCACGALMGLLCEFQVMLAVTPVCLGAHVAAAAAARGERRLHGVEDELARPAAFAAESATLPSGLPDNDHYRRRLFFIGDLAEDFVREPSRLLLPPPGGIVANLEPTLGPNFAASDDGLLGAAVAPVHEKDADGESALRAAGRRQHGRANRDQEIRSAMEDVFQVGGTA